MVTANTVGLVYSGYGPTILPAGFDQIRIGPVLSLALGAITGLNGATAGLNVSYSDDEVAGVDETSLQLHRWNAPTRVWELVPSSPSPARNVVAASLTELGVFAVFADASPDAMPPGAINDLTADAGAGGWTVELAWTAPGDDGNTGQATAYEWWQSTAAITADNWADATPASLGLTAAAAGTHQSRTLQMPDPGVQYYFALRAQDEAGNLGPLSNIATARSHELDADGDEMPDAGEATYQFNSSDPSDADADAGGDSLTNAQECQLGTNPRAWDTDGDGMGDQWEHAHGLDPRSAQDRDTDGDADGLSNHAEHSAATDPGRVDTDGDGLPDGWETDNHLSPISGSGVNGADGDADRDGRSNRDEYVQGSNPWLLDAPRLVGWRLLTEGGFELSVEGQISQTYRLEVFTDLVDWVEVREFVCTDRPTIVADTNPVTSGHRFYRIAH